jgi:hypothetical protein
MPQIHVTRAKIPVHPLEVLLVGCRDSKVVFWIGDSTNNKAGSYLKGQVMERGQSGKGPVM